MGRRRMGGTFRIGLNRRCHRSSGAVLAFVLMQRRKIGVSVFSHEISTYYLPFGWFKLVPGIMLDWCQRSDTNYRVRNMF